MSNSMILRRTWTALTPVGAMTVALVFGFAAQVAAQLPQTSAAALGTGFTNTASARGFAAIAVNPAGLAMDDGPGASLALPSLFVEAGVGPVTLADLAEWEGRLVPAGVKDRWIQDVTAQGGQSGTVGVGATPVAFSLGPLGVQVSTQGASRANFGPDAVELLLYGNAGRTGTAEDFDLVGSTLDAFVLTTAAVGWGFRASDRLHLGVTGKYTVGNGLVVGRDDGSALRSDPLSAQVRFPVLFPGSGEFQFDRGTGIGFDVGAIWAGPAVTLGVAVQNVVNTFEWDVESFSYVAGQALFEQGSSESDFEELPATGAPSILLAEVDELTLKPVFSAGALLRAGSMLSLTADVRKRVSGGLSAGPDFRAGVGAELRLIPILPLRGHFAVVSEGVQVGGGLGLALGPVHLNGAIALRTGEFGDATLGMVTLSFGGS